MAARADVCRVDKAAGFFLAGEVACGNVSVHGVGFRKGLTQIRALPQDRGETQSWEIFKIFRGINKLTDGFDVSFGFALWLEIKR